MNEVIFLKKDKSNPENFSHERELWDLGYKRVAGIDECGRGPFSGPVVACAVIMPIGVKIERLTDSKLLSKKEHEYFADKIKDLSICVAIGEASVEEIDRLNIKKASQLAMKLAVERLAWRPDFLLIDGNEKVDLDIQQKAIVKGDFNSHTISAASIVAKVYRDRLIAELDEQYGGVYGWRFNAGYQTADHIEACKTHGLTPHHRRTWKTVQLFDK